MAIAIAMSHDNYYDDGLVTRRRFTSTRCGNTKIDGHARMVTILVLGVHSGDDYAVLVPRTLHA